MDSGDLRPDQSARLRDAVRPPLAWLGRLRKRMDELGFPPQDPLYQSVLRAHNAMQELHVRAHYGACTSGVGR